MSALLYSAICSLDGYVADADGSFAWAAPDAEVHAHVNDLERGVGTHLLGRRMYEVLRYWDADDPQADRDAVAADYRRLWQSTDKVVYSSTLTEPVGGRAVVRATFDPDEVRALKRTTTRALSIGGPTLAARALAEGLVDEVLLYRHPVVVGGGRAALPAGLRLDLELLDASTFGSGVSFTRHRVRN
jgi:dihydrofolate reductase